MAAGAVLGSAGEIYLEREPPGVLWRQRKMKAEGREEITFLILTCWQFKTVRCQSKCQNTIRITSQSEYYAWRKIVHSAVSEIAGWSRGQYHTFIWSSIIGWSINQSTGWCIHLFVSHYLESDLGFTKMECSENVKTREAVCCSVRGMGLKVIHILTFIQSTNIYSVSTVFQALR